MAQDKSPEAEVAPDFLYVRKTPSTNAEILGDFPRGLSVIVLGTERNPNDSGVWVFVKHGEGGSLTGWVRSDFLRFPSNFVGISTLPVVSTEGSTTGTPSTGTTTTTTTTTTSSTTSAAVSVQGGLAARTSQFANLRTGPELNFDVVVQLRPNTPVVLTGRNRNSVWLQAVVGTDVGWLFYALVDSDGDVNSLPVVGAGDPPPVISTTTTGETGVAAPAPAGNAPTTLRVNPNVVGFNDGRINATNHLGFDSVYCVDKDGFTNTRTLSGGGIAVYRSDLRSIVFFVSEGQINAAKANPAPNGVVVAQGDYVLYIAENNSSGTTFVLSGFNSDNQEPYSLRWKNCEAGATFRP